MTVVFAPAPDRRERKKSKTREALREAGNQLFATRGFDETTTQDIADSADVSQRTLFRYFPSKEALLYGDMEAAQGELRSALAGRPHDEPVLVSLRSAFAALADDFERHREGRLLQARLAAAYPSVSAYFRATVQLAWERDITAAIAQRLAVDPLVDPRPEIIAGASMSAIRIASRQWVATDGTADFTELVGRALGAIAYLGELDTANAPSP